MATSFSLIYKKFLSQVDDYELGLLEDEELDEVLFEYLDMARSLYFPQCNKDLTAIDEDFGEFVEDISATEQYILVLGMKKAWMSAKVNNTDLMSKAIGDRDYKAIQGDRYLKELPKLEKRLEEEIRRYAVEYTYQGFSLEGW